MILKLSFSFPVFLLALLFCTAANGNDRPEQDQPQLFTDQDIEQYKLSSDSIRAGKNDTQPGPYGSGDKKQRILEDREKEYWCKKGSAAKKKIEKAESAVTEINKEIAQQESKSLRQEKKITQLKKNLKKAGKQLTDAKTELDELETEAHRKGVPPGWLRCQI